MAKYFHTDIRITSSAPEILDKYALKKKYSGNVGSSWAVEKDRLH
jgi:hypothetical protein